MYTFKMLIFFKIYLYLTYPFFFLNILCVKKMGDKNSFLSYEKN